MLLQSNVKHLCSHQAEQTLHILIPNFKKTHEYSSGFYSDPAVPRVTPARVNGGGGGRSELVITWEVKLVFELNIKIPWFTYVTPSLWVMSLLFSPFPRSSKAAPVLATWWLSAHWGRRVGCRPLSPPQRRRDTFSRMKASLHSPRTRSKWGFTITEEKALSALWPPFTPLRKVGDMPAAQRLNISQ